MTYDFIPYLKPQNLDENRRWSIYKILFYQIIWEGAYLLVKQK